MIDPKAPMSLGAFIAVVGTLITWVLFYIQIRNFRAAEQARRRNDDEHMEELIEKVCEAFTNSDSFLLRRDRAMIAVAQNVTDEQFRIRASSFVDAAVDQQRRAECERRIAALERSHMEIQKDFREAAGKISAEVTTNIAKFLRKSGD